MVRNIWLTLIVGAMTMAWGQQVIITGLQAPQRLVLTPRGNFLVTETSTEANSGRVSFVSRSGTRRSLIENLPSGAATTGDASGPTGLALRGRTLYLAIGGGDAERSGTAPGTAMFNPAGMSSPIFSSVLQFKFSADVDLLNGTFTFTPVIQQQLSDGKEVTLNAEGGDSVQVSVLADIPDATTDPRSIYRFSNPWGIELSSDAKTLYVADASSNALVSIDTATGRWRRLARFAPIPNTAGFGPPVSDPVPTSVREYGDQLLVSFLTGFPFVRGAGRVLIMQPDGSGSSPFMFGLSSITDVAWRDRGTSRPQFFVIEHSLNMLASPRAPGRLLRFDTPDAIVMSDSLQGPVSIALDNESNSVIVLELSGRIVEFKL